MKDRDPRPILDFVNTAMRARPPAVAGSFYPDDPDELRALVDRLLERGPERGPLPKALIVPHAGYPYSGPVAATAYARLREERRRLERIVLLGPAHHARLDGLALPEADAYGTPLGVLAVERAARKKLRELPAVIESDVAHEGEHSLEVQLPFLQRVLGIAEDGAGVDLVPLVVGNASPASVELVLTQLWGGDETLVVVSTDLSHYLPWEIARASDERTARQIEAGMHVEPHQACGAYALNGLIRVARKRGLVAERLDLRSSGDTCGARDRVVGYGAFALHEARP